MKWLYILPVMFVLAACGDSEDDEEVKPSEPMEVLYNRAADTFSKQEYKSAIEEFEEVERQHPYSDWATKAQVMAAFSAYKAAEFDDAVDIIDRFVKLHPTHPSAAYAYYLKALCYYIQITDVGRDQSKTEDARKALKEVIARYPDSDYAKDAKLKLDLTEDHLAGKEMEIGRYYLKQQQYLAAINRFKSVVDNYQTTSHAAEALHRLVECYVSLGVMKEAKRYAAVLGYNYPGSEWYQFSYKLMKGNLSPEERESTFDKYLAL
jgi:outer membrane protein assembly factor BamD